MSKEIEILERRIDRILDRLDKVEEKLSQIQLNEIVVMGKEIQRVYKGLQAIGVLDIYKIHDELLQLKQTLTRIEYHPWEWLQRDPAAQRAFLSRIRKMISDEIKQAAFFTIYQENPQVVVKIVKDAVREFLEIWEVNDQIARQIVDNVLKDGYFKELVNHITTLILSPEFKRQFLQMLVESKELYEAKELLEKEG